MQDYTKFPHGLMFHHFHDEEHPPGGQGSISAREFEEILHLVGIENILSPEEWIFKLKNNKLSQNNLCITLDDGLKCQYDVCLPILEKYNIRGFWHVYSSVFEGSIEKIEVYAYFRSRYFKHIDDFYKLFFKKCEESEIADQRECSFESFYQEYKSKFPFYSSNDIKFRFIRDEILDKSDYEKIMDAIIEEKGVSIIEISKNLWMTNSDLKSLSDRGHSVGLHSYNHPTVISKLSFDEQFNQYNKNYEHIVNVCNKEIVSMAHPCGKYNDDTLRVLKELGILCGLRSNISPPTGKKVNPNPLEMAREDCANILKEMKQ